MKALTKLQTLLLLCCIHVVADAEPIRQGMVLPPLAIAVLVALMAIEADYTFLSRMVFFDR